MQYILFYEITNISNHKNDISCLFYLITKNLKENHKSLSKAIYDYNLICDNDNILIGISGGKDSLCLVDLISRRLRINKPSFSAEALHIRMANIKYESDISYLKTSRKVEV